MDGVLCGGEGDISAIGYYEDGAANSDYCGYSTNGRIWRVIVPMLIVCVVVQSGCGVQRLVLVPAAIVSTISSQVMIAGAICRRRLRLYVVDQL